MSLTPRQHDLLTFVRQYQTERDGVSPSYREIASAIGVASVNAVYNLVKGLEERGFIRHASNRKRGIELVSENPFDIPSEVRLKELPDDTLWELDRRVMAEIRTRRNAVALHAVAA